MIAASLFGGCSNTRHDALSVLPIRIEEHPAIKETDLCAAFRKSLPSEITQGFVTVPKDWEQPSGDQIRVFYYAHLRKNSQGQLAQPVVFFNGGPASDSHSTFKILDSLQTTQDFSMVYLDQRGTGCSDPFPSSWQTPEAAKDLTHYSSRSIVQDAESIRTQLFGTNSRWHAFGQSYGGYIVRRYVEVAPHSLSGAFIHGASVMSDPLLWMTERLKSQKRITETYLKIFPQDRDLLETLRTQIPESRCFESEGSRICGAAVLDALTAVLGFRSSWTHLHRTIESLILSNGTLNESALLEFVRSSVFGLSSAQSGFALSILSAMDLTAGATDRETCERALQRLRETSAENPDLWIFNECRLLSALQTPWEQTTAALRNADPFSFESLDTALTENPTLPIFLYAGALDSFVPVSSFEEEMAKFSSRIRYKIFPESGHEGFYSEQQIWTDLKSTFNSR